MRRFLVALGAMMAWSVEASAQPADAGRRLSPRSDAVFVSVTDMDRGELEARDIRIGLAAPIARGDGYGLALLGKYGATWIDDDERLRHTLLLHRFELLVGGGTRLAAGWSLRGAIGDAYASDLHAKPAFEAFQLTLAGMVHHVMSDRDAWSLGFAYADTTNFYPLLPTIGFVHQAPDSPFRFDMLLPHHVRVLYQLTPRFHVALGIEAHGDKWVIESKEQRIYAERYGGAVFIELGVALTKLVKLDARVGASFDQYTLPDSVTGVARELSLNVSSFAQLNLILAP